MAPRNVAWLALNRDVVNQLPPSVSRDGLGNGADPETKKAGNATTLPASFPPPKPCTLRIVSGKNIRLVSQSPNGMLSRLSRSILRR